MSMLDLQRLLFQPCRTPDQLHAWVQLFTGLDVPRTSVCDGHAAPFDYLVATYFEPTSDLVVWAPRGGGKTRLAAVATLLDLLHKPPVACRVLGGSLEQSMKLWQYLRPDMRRLARSRLKYDLSQGLGLTSGATAAVLTQSERSVRGLRVQKLRCDEVELFDDAVWEAAQLTTRSLTTPTGTVSGSIEALSTLHEPSGLMNRLVDRPGIRLLRWCLLDVLEPCPAERKCDGCPLWNECRGVAKTKASGFLSIDDAVRMKGRVSRETWESEMLCRRPSVRGRVFPHFDLEKHVRKWGGECERIDLGVDFGFSGAFACLWIATDATGVAHVIDEHIQPQWTLENHVAEIRRRPWPAARRIHCDPAGAGANGQTGTSDIAFLRRCGFAIRYRPSRISEGLELIRRRLAPASGPPRLFIDPRCRKLIAAMQAYRYPEVASENPLKDGIHDHPIDALRYHFVNEPFGGLVKVRRY